MIRRPDTAGICANALDPDNTEQVAASCRLRPGSDACNSLVRDPLV